MARGSEFTSFEEFANDLSSPLSLTPEPFTSQDFVERNKSNRNSRKNKTFDPPSEVSRVTRGMIIDWKAAHHYDRYDSQETFEDDHDGVPNQLLVDRLQQIYGGGADLSIPVANVYPIFDKVPPRSMTEVRLRDRVNRDHTMLAGTEYPVSRISGDD